MDQWLIVATPSGPHLWNLGPDVAHGDELARLVDSARVMLDFPAGHTWLDTPDWRCHVAPGEPHAKLLAAATVHRVEDLSTVDPVAVDAYQAEGERLLRQAQADALKAALSQADPATRAEVIAHVEGKL